MKFDKWIVTFFVLVGLAAQSNSQPLNDPAIHGMQALPRVEGCNAPGGLQPITSSAGPNEAQFWCGTPPYCLTMPVGSAERCHIITGTRNGGTTGVRDPEDLICDVVAVNPTGPTHAQPGRCPLPPTLGAMVNGVTTTTVLQGNPVTLRVNTFNAQPLRTPTSLSMRCTGANAGISPFNQTNLLGIAGKDHSFAAVSAVNAGLTTCEVTASTAAGAQAFTVSFNATAPAPVASASPPPAVSAAPKPTAPKPAVQAPPPPPPATYHFQVCFKQFGNGGNGGGCYKRYWTPPPSGKCSLVYPVHAQPGYSAVLSAARKIEYYATINFVQKCTR